MKTTISAVIGIVILALIIILASTSHKKDDTAPADTSMTTPDTTTVAPTDTTTNPMPPTNNQPADKLQVTTTTPGTGTVAAKNGDTVSLNYTGMLTNGTVFDSNVDPKFKHAQPFQFVLGQGMVIAGWDQGVLGMKVGEKRHFVIPAALAYGAASPSPLIPANSTLVFDVELLAINPQ